MKVIIFDGYWTVKDVQKNKKWIFIYGDNDIQKGKKGQAIIKDEPNTAGIPTKKYPSYNKDAYYTDDELKENMIKIDKAIKNVYKMIEEKEDYYEAIVFPEDGLGTGLANLPNGAPKTYEYLLKSLKQLADNFEPKSSSKIKK